MGQMSAMSRHSDNSYRPLMTGHPRDGWKMARIDPDLYRKSTGTRSSARKL
jgi:hypothetical protein